MARYEISNTASGMVLGTYEAETASEAIRAMLADAGATGEEAGGEHLQAREVDPRCLNCGRVWSEHSADDKMFEFSAETL
jgi:hypothetical protein